MVQQDNKPNNETTVDGRPLFKGQPHGTDKPSVTQEYVKGTIRDDDPLLSDEERDNTRADILHESVDSQPPKAPSHPN